MRPRVAIVGSGVTAGLAASVLSQTNDVIVIQPTEIKASPIPEIVPRRAFFENAFLGPKAEARIIEQASSPVRWVAWRRRSGTQKHRLTTNKTYFVYDKGRLAKALLDNTRLYNRITRDVPRIAEITDYHAVLDCRGAQAVQADPAYETEPMGNARTHCTYVIAQRPIGLDPETMEFWAETGPTGHRRTFYVVPVGESMISLGCSGHPSDPVDHAHLLDCAAEAGIGIVERTIVMRGEAEPRPTIVHNRLSHVRPVGDARGMPCPLTQYGTLIALSQISEISGGKRLPRAVLNRPPSREIDPHMPMELFA